MYVHGRCKWIKTTPMGMNNSKSQECLLCNMFVTLDTSHRLMSPLNEEAPQKAVVLEEEEKWVRCDLD
jgi:hypothetical protein